MAVVPTKTASEPVKITGLEDYLFDLRGYLLLENAVDADHIRQLNAALDPYVSMKLTQWRGNIHRLKAHEIHNIVEAGEPFERLIDHASWISHIRHYAGHDGLFIDEAFVNVKGQGGATRLHSGGHKRRIRTQFRFHNNEFRCGQIVILLALTEIDAGGGGTMVIPGSHKSNLSHPAFIDGRSTDGSVEGIEGAVEVQMKAGDALLFVDCIAHGSAQRRKAGERRVAIYRYGPHWGNSRYGYQPSAALLERLTPQRRRIIQPLNPRRNPEASIY